ncbi:hypothetical protein GGH95_000060 [Coemansia sp. RSA 1836]|nr:hypothetical protein GGF38_003462 [Coemansia sp. RSA 25]KAJ2584900.1 hypothetical protein GGH95_000060 [Coemansia sp. RSA 1836]
MAPRDIASLVESNSSKLQTGERAENVMALFGPPEYMGNSLNDLRSPESAAVPMPGVVVEEPGAKQAARVTSETGDIKTQPIAEDEPHSQQYYVAYGAGENKVLWFHIRVDDKGNEVLTERGWKDMTT